MTELIIIIVDGYGYLPIVKIDGEEVYRGSYKGSSSAALLACESFVNSRSDYEGA